MNASKVPIHAVRLHPTARAVMAVDDLVQLVAGDEVIMLGANGSSLPLSGGNARTHLST